jgi:hypothetical protein
MIHCKEFKTCPSHGEQPVYMGPGRRPLLPMCQVCDGYDPVDTTEVVDRDPVEYPFKSNPTEIQQLKIRIIALENVIHKITVKSLKTTEEKPEEIGRTLKNLMDKRTSP